MSDFVSLSGEPRDPTAAEREMRRELRAVGVQDVYLDPENTPAEWWRIAVLLTDEDLVLSVVAHLTWPRWLKEMRFRQGWPAANHYPAKGNYQTVVESGLLWVSKDYALTIPVSVRLAAIETLLDVETMPKDLDGFRDRLNERAGWFQVCFRLVGKRFVDVRDQHLHAEIVQPTLLLLHDNRFAGVDDLYRTGFARYQQGDYAGAITVVTSAVETILRLGLGLDCGTLDALAKQAQSKQWALPAVAETARKLHALRTDSDAHQPGTDRPEVAQFALHLAGTVLLFLGETFPSP